MRQLLRSTRGGASESGPSSEVGLERWLDDRIPTDAAFVARCSAIESSVADEADRARLAELDACSFVLDVMAQLEGSHAAQSAGLGALLRLMQSSNRFLVEMVRLQGVAAVLKAMRDFEASACIQDLGCRIVLTLAGTGSNMAHITREGGIVAVLAGMQGHSGNVEVQEYGCAALIKLALDPENTVRMAAAGGIGIVLAAMQGHSSNAKVQEYGCGALRNLAGNDENTVVCGGGRHWHLSWRRCKAIPAMRRCKNTGAGR
ncbi:hypothetical protein CYMTET_33803 [Cymbomonas tetramitiformis]|uniref:LRRK2 ARM repeat domain-containing protein n=1 Tax=Cymbomonas tetramitiformis TaxID=36881 RepID=A0AAE0FCX3_9CHLO|nr:hypothetical protein CYMTET_33803 [Cymbomonas tetramitiformis]